MQIVKIGKNWYSDFTHNGKRIKRVLSPYREEAILKLPDLVKSVRGFKPGEAQNMSWSLFKSKHLDYSVSEQHKNTQIKNRRAFALVDEHFTIDHLSQMTPELLGECVVEWKKAGVTPSVVTRSVKAIKTAMRRAEDFKYVPLQNWRIVKVQEPASRLIYYTLDQFKALLAICTPPWKMCAMLMGRAGLRFGEAYNLEWVDVDFYRERLRVHSKEGWRIKGDKRGNAEKYIPIEPSLLAFLEKNRKATGYVVQVEGYGERMTDGSFLAHFCGLFAKAKLPGSPHALRHTCATMMISHGATLEEVAAVLGHKDLKATMIYAHLMPEATRRAINKLPKL